MPPCRRISVHLPRRCRGKLGKSIRTTSFLRRRKLLPARQELGRVPPLPEQQAGLLQERMLPLRPELLPEWLLLQAP